MGEEWKGKERNCISVFCQTQDTLHSEGSTTVSQLCENSVRGGNCEQVPGAFQIRLENYGEG